MMRRSDFDIGSDVCVGLGIYQTKIGVKLNRSIVTHYYRCQVSITRQI